MSILKLLSYVSCDCNLQFMGQFLILKRIQFQWLMLFLSKNCFLYVIKMLLSNNVSCQAFYMSPGGERMKRMEGFLIMALSTHGFMDDWMMAFFPPLATTFTYCDVLRVPELQFYFLTAPFLHTCSLLFHQLNNTDSSSIWCPFYLFFWSHIHHY